MATPQEQASLGDISLVVEDPLRDPRLTMPSSVKWNRNEGVLEWTFPHEKMGSPNARGLLQKFVALHGRPDIDIVEFAQRYGVLGLTRRGLIEGSRATRDQIGANQDLIDQIDHGKIFRERIAYWRPYIATLRYITACFTRLRVDPSLEPATILTDEGFPETMEELWGSFGLGPITDYTKPLVYWMLTEGPHNICDNIAAAREAMGPAGQLMWLSNFVTSVWIPLGGVHVALASDGQRVQTVLRMGGIWAPGYSGIMEENSLRNVLVAQLLALATRPAPSEMVACSRCGTFYEPLRMPTAGQPHYCPTCKPIIAREQKRQWAAKKRAAQREASGA